MSGQQYTDQKIATPDHSPLPLPLNHEDSDLTVHQVDDKTEVDVEKASAAFDPSEAPVLVDGPLYGWVIVFASFMSQMISMGICNVYGVYQVRKTAPATPVFQLTIDPPGFCCPVLGTIF